MVLTVSFVLSPVTGLFATVAPKKLARSLLLKNLTPASGRQDHTTSPSASQRARQSRRLRPPHPRPTFVTIAKRPSVLGRDASDKEVIWVEREWKYFCKGDWTPDSQKARRAKSAPEMGALHLFVIPGCAKREPGIHNHDGD
jgi:hypothetical protein